MKNIFIIILLASINCFSQPNKVGLTTSPLAPSAGIYFISKPVVYPLSFYSSFEYANYLKNAGIETYKFAFGPSIVVPNFIHFSDGKTQDIDIHVGASFNFDPGLELENYKELSIETGFSIRIKKEIYFSFMIDLPNNHFKFGVAIGLIKK